MHDLEPEFTAWRKRMALALGGSGEVLRELESHLRDSVDELKRQGKASEEAFALAVARLGNPTAVAAEFHREQMPWFPATWPVRIVVSILGAGLAVMWFMLAASYAGGALSPLLFVHVITITTGYFAVLASGIVGMVGLLLAWRRGLGRLAIGEVRAWIFRLAALAVVTVAAGMGLGMIWAAENLGAAWSWHQLEIGTLFVLFAAVLLLVGSFRRMDDFSRWIIAGIGSVSVLFAMFGAKALAPVPFGWMAVALILSHVAVLLPGRSMPSPSAET